MSLSQVRLESGPARRIAVVRQTVTAAALATVVPAACGEVWNTLRAQGQRGGRNIALYWDAAIRVEAGVEFDGEFQETSRVIRSTTPAGPAASVTLLGPYGELDRAHQAIHQWCRAHHHTLLGPRWEIYGHWQEEWNRDPSLIRTDVYYQVTPP